MEDDLKYFCKWKMNSNLFLLMEDLKLIKFKWNMLNDYWSRYFVGQKPIVI